MDKCGICLKPAFQLFETSKEGVYACFKCQPLVPEVTIEDSGDHSNQDHTEITIKNEEGVADASLYCGICQKSFEKNAQLQNHMRNHRAERRFVCMYCNKAFSQSNNLRAHLRIHTNERPYKCSDCGKAFTQVTNLNNHVRLHTGERPFVCPEPGCNKAYAQVTNLNQHRKRHLNGRPVESTYDCTICGEQFEQRNHMYIHKRDVHSELRNVAKSPRRGFACKLCNQVFSNNKLLQMHVAQHAAEVDMDSKGMLTCVFRACGARLRSAHEHTEHLLSAHQLRVLSAPAHAPAASPTPAPAHAAPPRRGRPRKTASDITTSFLVHKSRNDKSDPEQDPLEITDSDFHEVHIIDEHELST